MRTRLFAVLAACSVALGGAPSAAYAQPHDHHGDSIRYASIRSCPAKDGTPKPCGGWRLVMHSGAQRTLTDAQGVALDAKGKSTRYFPAAIAVSGNGRKIAYFTKAGRLAVRTLGGGVQLLAKDALPRVGQNEVTLLLSDDGARLAAAVAGEKPVETRIFDTATGALLGTVPGDLTVAGFSGDGGEVLTSVQTEESVTDLAVYSDEGEQLARVAPPQLVASNGPQALAADGRTVANVVTGARTELVTYDLSSDEVTGRKKLKLPAGDLHMIDWTGDTQVTLHLIQHLSRGARMTIVQIDTETAAVKVRDRYTLLKDTFVFAACGG
ncbi:hypothetical protein [Nonomuraea zeae]|uniref:WD40 repeat domain-containing protein n=1 Tax=Nonomuraea zeae TaxID=1642303 RepID=A0A5S4FRV6_9ACTN|nr:hypothetical protein [Nonomuraea zeae]TMR23485.1 hypothetical protein ETD85_47990 [Nonomuraea zeae]